MTVVAANSNYPCCGRIARFSNADQAPDSVVHRTCDRCKQRWIVTRRRIGKTEPRLDELVWTSWADWRLREKDELVAILEELERKHAEGDPMIFIGGDPDREHGFRAIDVARNWPTFTPDRWRDLYKMLDELALEGRITRVVTLYKRAQVPRYRTPQG
jgi:hypothetical protein